MFSKYYGLMPQLCILQLLNVHGGKGVPKRNVCNVGGLACSTFIKRMEDKTGVRYKTETMVCMDREAEEQLIQDPQEQRTFEFESHQLQMRDCVSKLIQMFVMRSCSDFVERKEFQRQDRHGNSMVPRGYQWLGNGTDKMYMKHYTSKQTWDQAQDVCLADGGGLVKLDTKQKMILIKKTLGSPHNFLKRVYMWIGLRDFKRNNVFQWVDKSALEFSDWFDDQPTNTGVASNGTMVEEDCVALIRHVWHGFHWSDMDCSTKNSFICEMKRNATGLKPK